MSFYSLFDKTAIRVLQVLPGTGRHVRSVLHLSVRCVATFNTVCVSKTRCIKRCEDHATYTRAEPVDGRTTVRDATYLACI